MPVSGAINRWWKMVDTILIVDDDPTQRRLLQAALERQGFKTRLAVDGPSALIALDAHSDIQLMLLDLVMPGKQGLEVLADARRSRPALPVVVLTASGSVDVAVQATKAGANDFLVKPTSPERLVTTVHNALETAALKGEVVRLAKRPAGRIGFDSMIAASPAMRMVTRLGQRAAASSIPVLITGESGVGKELLARAIQGASERAAKPFIAVNCGALPENLVESILFGHAKGAFTGAVADHPGKFVEANHGTLFLDEVGELPLDAQVKLLRALQEGEVDPVGAKRPVKVDVRVLSATNKDLHKLVEAGRFREDLYYRLNVFPIEAPPLRDRREDIPAMAARFIARFAAEENRPVRGCTPQAMAMLCQYDWPGNVRQLENAIFRAVVLSEGGELSVEDFPHVSGLQPLLAAQDTPLVQESMAPANDAAPLAAPGFGPGFLNQDGHVRAFIEVERELIISALKRYHGRMTEVARRLGIGRSTLYRKMREYSLEEAAFRMG